MRATLVAWRYLDDLGPPQVVRRQTEYLGHDGADAKALAPNVGDLGGEHAQASGLMRIPARCLTRVRKLTITR